MTVVVVVVVCGFWVETVLVILGLVVRGETASGTSWKVVLHELCFEIRDWASGSIRVDGLLDRVDVPIGVSVSYFDVILGFVAFDHGLSVASIGHCQLGGPGWGVGRVHSHGVDLLQSQLFCLVLSLDHLVSSCLSLAGHLLHLESQFLGLVFVLRH